MNVHRIERWYLLKSRWMILYLNKKKKKNIQFYSRIFFLYLHKSIINLAKSSSSAKKIWWIHFRRISSAISTLKVPFITIKRCRKGAAASIESVSFVDVSRRRIWFTDSVSLCRLPPPQLFFCITPKTLYSLFMKIFIQLSSLIKWHPGVWMHIALSLSFAPSRTDASLIVLFPILPESRWKTFIYFSNNISSLCSLPHCELT